MLVVESLTSVPPVVTFTFLTTVAPTSTVDFAEATPDTLRPRPTLPAPVTLPTASPPVKVVTVELLSEAVSVLKTPLVLVRA